MKKILLLSLCMILFAGMTQAQTEKTVAPKKNQFDVLNEFYVTYGIGSIYYYIERNNNSGSFTNIGSFIAGYTRSINKVIGVGFLMAYTPLHRDYNLSSGSSQSMTYNYIQALARIRFQYLNKPSFGMYSGIAIGVSMNYYNELSGNTTTNKQDLLPAGQLTLLGFRVGRGAAFNGEFGIGTLSILNLGISFKFGQ